MTVPNYLEVDASCCLVESPMHPENFEVGSGFSATASYTPAAEF